MPAAAIRRYPFLRLLLPLVAGIACGDVLPCRFPATGWIALFLSLFLLLAVCHRRRARTAYAALLFLLLGAVGVCLSGVQQRESEYPFTGRESVCRVRLLERPAPRERSLRCTVQLLAEADAGREGGTPPAVEGRKIFLFYLPKEPAAATLQPGDELWVRACLSPPGNFGDPGAFDYVRYLRHKGVCGTAYIPAGQWQRAAEARGTQLPLRLRMAAYRERVVALYRRLGFGGDELAVLSALTVGYKEELSDNLKETYSAAGASHVLALSGLHIGLLYWLLRSLLLLPAGRRRLPWLKAAVTVAVLWGFALLTGMPSSVVRSVSMFSLLALADFQPERPLTLNTLAATAFLMLLCRPAWLFDVGFQLSFTAVAAIVLLQPRLYALWHPQNGLLRAAWGLATVSVAAQAGTAPLVAYYFSRFSCYFLLSNFWAIPCVTLALYAAVLLLLLMPLPTLQLPLARALEGLLQVQNRGLQVLERLPGATVDHLHPDACEVVLCYLLLAAFYRACLLRTARRLMLCLCLLLVLLLYHLVKGW